MTTPIRILDQIRASAETHETTAERILGGAKDHATVAARQSAIMAAAKAPKPSGRLPGIRELARWFNMTPGHVSRIVR